MYGTIAGFRIKPGMEAQMEELGRQEFPRVPGLVFHPVYRSDADPNACLVVVAFECKAAHRANATSPEQHERYRQYSALMESDPEWHDGEIVSSYQA